MEKTLLFLLFLIFLPAFFCAQISTFYFTLKSPDSDLENQRVTMPYWISQVYLGVSVSKQFRITADIPIATTRQIELPDKIQIGIQVIPNRNK